MWFSWLLIHKIQIFMAIIQEEAVMSTLIGAQYKVSFWQEWKNA